MGDRTGKRNRTVTESRKKKDRNESQFLPLHLTFFSPSLSLSLSLHALCMPVNCCNNKSPNSLSILFSNPSFGSFADVCSKNNGKHSFHSLNGSTLTRREELLLKTAVPPVPGLMQQQEVKEEVKSGERRKRGGEKRSHCDMIEEMMTVGGQEMSHDTCDHSPLSPFGLGVSTVGGLGLGPHGRKTKKRKTQNTLREDSTLPLSKNGPLCGPPGITSVLWWPHPSTSSSSFSPSTTTMTIPSTPNTATTSSSSPFSPSSSSLPSPPPAEEEEERRISGQEERRIGGQEERRISGQDGRGINGSEERRMFHSSSLHFSPAESSLSTSPSCDGSERGEKRMKQSSRSQSKSKRIRTIFKADQLEKLESEFMHQQYMVGPERRALAGSMGLSEAQVKVWFQNRRIKWRKQTDEETKRRMVGDLERIVEGPSPSQPLFSYH